MKKIILFAVLSMIFLCSCEKMLPEGGYTKRDIYILLGNVPVDAQDYVLTIPCDAGEYDIPFLTWGIYAVTVLKECPGIEISIDDNTDSRDEFAYLWGYKEYVHISSGANTGNKSRKLKFSLVTGGGNGHRADITILQKGR